MSSSIGKFAKTAAIGLGAAGVAAGALAKSAIDAASNLNESLSKVNVVFGESAKEIEAWSKTAAKSLGMSQQKALEAAGTFGNLFSAMKISRQESVKMSKGIVELARDLASFNNARPEDVLIALKAGLVGETEPLRQFGINLSAARIEAEAFSMGLVKGEVDLLKLKAAQQKVIDTNAAAIKALREHGVNSNESAKATLALEMAENKLGEVMAGKIPKLNEAQKAQAAYSLIMQDSTLAQGDFARTADGAANQQRILAAQVEDLQAKIGQKLLPIYQDLLRFTIERLIPGIEDAGRKVEVWWAKQDGLKEAIKEGQVQLREFIEDVKTLVAWAQEAADKIQTFIDKLNSIPGVNFGLNDLPGWDKGPRVVDRGLIDIIKGKAAGGPVAGGRPYLVGERGPELFVPGMSGSIVPNHAMRATQPIIVYGQIDRHTLFTWMVDASRDAGGIPLTLRNPS